MRQSVPGVYDVVRRRDWPEGYTGRLMKNEFIEKWHGREVELAEMQETELAKVEAAYVAGDYDTANVTVGESIGLVRDLPPAGELGATHLRGGDGALTAGSVEPVGEVEGAAGRT
jgi:NAD(P)H-dependent flavin oxidoreductase YrpB (nitropropane dioxygenase family)